MLTENMGIFDPVFLKISLVARQKLATFNSSNNLKCKNADSWRGLCFVILFWLMRKSLFTHTKPRLFYLITQLQEQPVGQSPESGHHQ